MPRTPLGFVMTRVAFLIDKPASHLLASMGLARRLARRGYTPEYWGDPQIEPAVTSQGFHFQKLDGLWSRYQAEIRLPTNLTETALLVRPRLIVRNLRARREWLARLPAALDAFAESFNALARERRPAFVVFDPFLLAYYPYIRNAGLPAVVLSTKPLPIPDPLVPPHTSYLLPADTLWGRWRTWLAWRRVQYADVRHRLLQTGARLVAAYTYEHLVREVARRNTMSLHDARVRRWVEPDLNFSGVQEWALWTSEMDLPRSRGLPANALYVGPSMDTVRTEPELCLPPTTRHKYLVYVAVGTVRFRWRDHVPFLRKVIAAFDNDPDVLVAISSADPGATEALTPAPANVIVCDFLPQLKMLDIADLVITHAGAGTLRECIMKEVPMLAYPAFHDQMGNSARIVYRGLGSRGRREHDSPADIRRKAFALLQDDTVRENLRKARMAVADTEEALLTRALQRVLAEDAGGGRVAVAERHPEIAHAGRL
jgi:zeaxanthin glucosyltransferase